ncbi:hypothetical protein BO79DRAFT_217478 [Aspergillus costaricaensis CBS 115574]|uniref:Uncharacterized protein n=1 Tax=Aspergillus costaricaensis CBS 115574 TaxID=1448317 RepID=A0ACD1IEL0_9EURO|nr:hypothetical protein BO79DRAFT_217478 [Aspergillus costaricaensis CBS 115574]RAK88739.1 hypothetical protein BO79DRAFT_217478 [Aspergillus costaricaensis CBS 115574]
MTKTAEESCEVYHDLGPAIHPSIHPSIHPPIHPLPMHAPYKGPWHGCVIEKSQQTDLTSYQHVLRSIYPTGRTGKSIRMQATGGTLAGMVCLAPDFPWGSHTGLTTFRHVPGKSKVKSVTSIQVNHSVTPYSIRLGREGAEGGGHEEGPAIFWFLL